MASSCKPPTVKAVTFVPHTSVGSIFLPGRAAFPDGAVSLAIHAPLAEHLTPCFLVLGPNNMQRNLQQLLAEVTARKEPIAGQCPNCPLNTLHIAWQGTGCSRSTRREYASGATVRDRTR
jgi:hypothetical protein